MVFHLDKHAFYSKDELGDKVLGGGWITKN